MNPVDPGPWNTEAKLGIRHLHDETLRDGLQACAAVDPPLAQKRAFLRALSEAGVGSACLALPGAGPRARDHARGLLETVRDERLSVRAVFAGRTCDADVDAIVEVAAVVGWEVEATLFLAASPIRVWVEGWSLPELAERAARAVRRARAGGVLPSLVLEDSSRTPPEALRRLMGAGLDAGARRVVLCDTVGAATPAGAYALTAWTRRFVGPNVGLDWHGHDDRGLALACALAAAEAGCDRIHGCVGGIGERVGNTDLEDLAAELARRGAGRWPASPLTRARDLVHSFGGAPKGLSAAS